MRPAHREKTLAALRDEHRRLAAWCHEWRLEQALAETESASDRVEMEPHGEPVAGRAADRAPEPGQVRLLVPGEPATASRPVYLFLAGRLSSGDWVGVPFGRLATPAVPGEWKTGLRKLPVRVLCAWNARRISGERMRCSWHAMSPPAAWRAAAERIVSRCFAEAPAWERTAPPLLPGSISSRRLGPPLLHPLDPRWSYLEQETERGDELGPPWGRIDTDRCYRGRPAATAGTGLYDLPSTDPARKAAEPPAPYDDR